MNEQITEEDLVNLVNSILEEKGVKSNSAQISEFFAFIRKIVENAQQESYPKNLKLARDYLTKARKDLVATRVLYDLKIYDLSSSHLQQTVEKTTKSFGLCFFLSKKDMRKISHKSPLAFIKIARKRWIEPYIVFMKMLYPTLKTNFEELEEILNSKEKSLEIARSNKETIAIFLGFIGSIKESVGGQKSIDDMHHVTDKIIAKFPFLKSHVETAKANVDLDLITQFLNMYILSCITYPHNSYGRYPEVMKQEEYTEDLGIVALTPEICNYLDKSIETIDKFLTESGV